MTSTPAIPPDDPIRRLSVTSPDDPIARHISLVGDVYTILLSGEDTDGRYCLIDMNVPPGGGPPPHRHDFEEMFTLVDGEIEFTFRGETSTVRAGSTINIPANAPHSFRNESGGVARMLCMCTPAGQEEFFMTIGDPVASRTAPPPKLSNEQREARRRRAEELAPKYRNELLPPLAGRSREPGPATSRSAHWRCEFDLNQCISHRRRLTLFL